MDWLEEVSLDDLLNSDTKGELNSDFTYKNLSTNSKTLTLSPTAQFFLSLSSNNNQKDRTQIPITSLSDTKLNSVIGELSACYEECIIQFVSNKPENLILKHPKKEALSLLKKVEKNPIIKDLFRLDKNINLMLGRNTEKSVYRVINESISGYPNEDFDNVYHLIQACYSGEGAILIPPIDWILIDKLKESVALRYFVHKCNNVYIWVDKSNNRVQYIQLVFSHV